MESLKERRAGRLLKNGSLWWIFGGLTLLCINLAFSSWMDLGSSKENLLPRLSSSEHEDSDRLSGSTESQTPAVPDSVKKAMDHLFEQIEQNPQGKERLLRELKRILQQTFAGQEDCWSCEGAVYFDKFDQIAGFGQARKPLGLREWIEEGDEAFQEQKLPEARRFYSQALQVLDERAFEDNEQVDSQALERLKSRCLQLQCR